jgi:tetratricopeptide (TPR) repeat protein
MSGSKVTLGLRKSYWLPSLLMLLAVVSVGSAMQTSDTHQADRKRALDLVNDGKFVDAVPLLQKLLGDDPTDAQVAFYLGSSIEWISKLEPDPAKRKQMRARGYAYLKQAHELGLKDAVLDQLLATLKPDGGEDSSYSTDPRANDAMVQGEAAFGGSQFDKAFAAYQQALSFDPKLYEAALFAGDALYKNGASDKAGDWYAKAILIDPDREIAYRYWGDVFMSIGKPAEAREKFIEAFITEPYNKLAVQGLINWAKKTNATLLQPRIDIPVNVTSSKKGKTDITLDANILLRSKGPSSAWIIYGAVRAGWMNEKFRATFPNEKEYRHSLPEEADALTAVALTVTETAMGGEVKDADVSITNLLALYKAGLIEPFVLLATPNAGIAQDYNNYRKSNREKLRRYVNEFVIRESK